MSGGGGGVESVNFDIYPNMYSIYGCSSLLKIVIKKPLKSSVYMYLLCYKYALWYLLYTCMWDCGSICNVHMDSVYTILRFIILFGIIFSETYIQHCQTIFHHQKNPPH